MGMSTKELILLIVLLISIFLYSIVPSQLIERGNRFGGFIALIIPYTILTLFLFFRIELRKRKKNGD